MTVLENETSTTQPESGFGRFCCKIPLIRRFTKTAGVISVLRLSGVISASGGLMSRGGLSLNDLNSQIEEAFAPKDLKAVALQINSPGGSPVQSELIFRRIRQLAAEKNVLVLSFVEDAGASGGYWLACAGDEIFASESSIVGSIGVVSHGFGFVEAIEKIGVERRVYTQGQNKDLLDPFQPSKPEGVAVLNQAMHDIHESFKAMVRERRAGKLNLEEERLFSGEFWTAKTALPYGVVDAIGDMYNVLQERYGDKIDIRKIESKKGWLKRKFNIANPLNAKEIAQAVVDVAAEKVSWAKLGM